MGCSPEIQELERQLNAAGFTVEQADLHGQPLFVVTKGKLSIGSLDRTWTVRQAHAAFCSAPAPSIEDIK
jgi:uncharacterized protein YgfB (UPF0149 family)